MDKVIIYRSQQEAAIDQFLMSGSFVPIFVGLAVFVFCVWCFSVVIEHSLKKNRNLKWKSNLVTLSMIPSAVLGLLTCYFLWI